MCVCVCVRARAHWLLWKLKEDKEMEVKEGRDAARLGRGFDDFWRLFVCWTLFRVRFKIEESGFWPLIASGSHSI